MREAFSTTSARLIFLASGALANSAVAGVLLLSDQPFWGLGQLVVALTTLLPIGDGDGVQILACLRGGNDERAQTR